MVKLKELFVFYIERSNRNTMKKSRKCEAIQILNSLYTLNDDIFQSLIIYTNNQYKNSILPKLVAQNFGWNSMKPYEKNIPLKSSL